MSQAMIRDGREMREETSQYEAYETGQAEPEGPYEIPPFWTSEHVAHRLIHAFDVLLTMAGRVGPKQYGTAWPASLKEFSDLVEDEIKSARDAYAAGIRRPTAEEISMSDEALAWPLKYAAHEPMACDAVLLWAMCKAGGFSIARMLRTRTIKAKAMAERMAAEQHKRAKAPLLAESRSILAQAHNLAAIGEYDPEIGQRALEVRGKLLTLRSPIVLPRDASPNKILSRSSLDRYLRPGLEYLAEQLHRAHVTVR